MKKIIIVLLITLLFCAVFVFPNKNVRAEEDISIEELCQIYTETDEPNELSLHTYVNDFYEIVDDCEENPLRGVLEQREYFANNVSVFTASGIVPTVTINIYGDDNITKIIPPLIPPFAQRGQEN